MKMGGDAFSARLARNLDPLYVVSGDEPLLVEEALDLLRERARADGCAERESQVAERGFDWDGFGAGLQTMSLFSARRLVELRLPSGKPGDSGARFLAGLAAQPDTGNVVVLVLPKLDAGGARSKWASALAESAVWVDLTPPERTQLPAWLQARLRRRNLEADAEALELLAARVEGNLLAASQEIDKLALVAGSGRIDAAGVREAVADGARFDVFQLADAALAGDTSRALRVLGGLEREGESPVLVLWALARDALQLADVVYRARRHRDLGAAMSEAQVWRNRQELVRRALRGRTVADVAQLLECAARADRVVKGVQPGEAWKAVAELALQLSGAPAVRAETA
jgi:DNA polymerase-3 subunit delta